MCEDRLQSRARKRQTVECRSRGDLGNCAQRRFDRPRTLANPPSQHRRLASVFFFNVLPGSALHKTRPLARRLPLELKMKTRCAIGGMSRTNQTVRAARVMKSLKYLSVIGLLAWSAASLALAQTNPVDAVTQPKRDGKVLVPERPTATDDANITATTLRPPRLERGSLPPEVQDRLDRFKADARAYLARQQALKKKLEGANDKERAAIREQLKEIQQQWVERAKEMRKEYKDRQAELADKLKDYRELLDNARSTAIKDAGGRTRRGDD